MSKLTFLDLSSLSKLSAAPSSVGVIVVVAALRGGLRSPWIFVVCRSCHSSPLRGTARARPHYSHFRFLLRARNWQNSRNSPITVCENTRSTIKFFGGTLIILNWNVRSPITLFFSCTSCCLIRIKNYSIFYIALVVKNTTYDQKMSCTMVW